MQEEDARIPSKRGDEEQSLDERKRDGETALKADRKRHEAVMAAEHIANESGMREAAARKAVADRQDKKHFQPRNVDNALPFLVVRSSVPPSIAALTSRQLSNLPSPGTYRTHPSFERQEDEARKTR